MMNVRDRDEALVAHWQAPFGRSILTGIYTIKSTLSIDNKPP